MRGEVRAIYARYGLKATLSKRQQVGYDPRRRSVRLLDNEPPGLHLHDLAHWLIAPPEVRRMFEFGLGQAPHLWDAGPRIKALVREDQELARFRWPDYYKHAETAASALNVALAERYFGEEEAQSTARELSIEYPARLDTRAYTLGFLSAFELLSDEVIHSI